MIKVKIFSKGKQMTKMHFIDTDLAYKVFAAVKALPDVESKDLYAI